MARVDNIIFCLRAINSGEQGVSASIILNAITPEYIPGLFTFSVIISLLDIERGGEHNISIAFIDPDGGKVVDIENQPLPVVMLNEGNLPDQYKGINIVMDWNNIDLKVSGLYTIEILYDGIKIGGKSIYVKGKNE